MITAPLPRASPSGTGRLSMIIPRYYGLTITYMSVVEKKFESYFRDRLTFSNVDSRTSRRIYRLALLLRAPETLFLVE